MPSSKFVVSSKVPETFRTNKVKGMFDCDISAVSKEYVVDIPVEDKEWNVGLIVGSSGSGKTTIAKKLFSSFMFFDGYDWREDCFLDDFDSSLSPKDITEALSKVGFASPPDWLKPFRVLSNGQKMRAELARLILESEDPVIYDEFTSVVDRQVAKIGSSAISKFIKKEGKQFIAVTCHYDVTEWLEPCWVFDVDKMKFSYTRRSLRRPEIEVCIRKADQSEWKEFKDFHYLSSSHNIAAHKYIAEINGESVAWCSVLHFPHPKVKNIKRIHRIVVKPDYQGIGLGRSLLKEVCSLYPESRVRIVTSAPSFIASLSNSREWVMTRKPSRLQNRAKSGVLAGTTSDARLTATFEYIGEKQ